MNRLDYLLSLRELIDDEINNISTGEVITETAKLHVRQYKVYGYRGYSKREKRDWALSIHRVNLDTGFEKWEPIVAGNSRDEVIDKVKSMVDDLNQILEECNDEDLRGNE